MVGLLEVVTDLQQARMAKELIISSRQRLSLRPVRFLLPMSAKTVICIGLFVVVVVAHLVSLQN